MITKILQSLLLLWAVMAYSLSAYANSAQITNKSLLPTPKFEGWYMRLTDSIQGRSFAVIVGSFMKTRNNFLPKKPMNGYLAVLVHENATGKTKVYETFPKDTTYTTNGEAIYGTHQLFKDSTFRWSSKQYGYVTQDHINIHIPDTLELHANIGDRIPWDRVHDHLGPEGMILNLPMVPVHWFVHSLGSQTDYLLTLFDQNKELSGTGFLHQEKNWGKAFPTAWIWSQGVSEDNSTQYALAGGEVKIPMMKKFTSWLIGIRGKKISWDFRQSRISTKFKTVIDPCRGHFKITASDSGHHIELDAKAPINSFGYVSIPTESGFKMKSGVESFNSKVQIKAYVIQRGKKILKEILNFKNAALEFGANYMGPANCYVDIEI